MLVNCGSRQRKFEIFVWGCVKAYFPHILKILINFDVPGIDDFFGGEDF